MMMYPADTWTDSQPHQAHPKAKEMNPSHINLSPLYQPWSYAGNYPHTVPHGCCSHTYYGGGPYGFQPHYTHYPPPPPPPSFHPYGFYSPFPGAYPAYSVPPQHYSAELPRYDYDKNNHATHHCCECHHRKDDKIKEESQVESQVDSKKCDSLAPLLLKDRPDYPIIWVPRGYTSNNSDSKAKEIEKYSHNPVLVKHPEPSKQGGNVELAHDEHGGDGDRFPFQILWLPSKNDEVGKDTKENTPGLVANKGLSDEKTIKNIECSGNEGESKTSHKNAVQKVIPVKQAGINEEKKSPKGTEMITKLNSVEKKTDNVSSASPKTSKLPPVCLRIEPMSRKKKTSRSPSPSEIQRSNGSQINDPKSSLQQTQVLEKSKEGQIEGNIKTLDHADKVERDNIADHGDIIPKGEEAGSEKEKAEEKKKTLSEDEAALIIQSVYRGFQVRKSEPLKKLRQIYQVRKQVFELRNRIQDLESFGVDGKKEVIIGETIMSLLLKLDTIQGLHPLVREIRKSVAKEVVGLQEKLDALTTVKPETPTTYAPQQVVMLPEDAVIQENSDQAQAQLDGLENNDHKATESQYDDVEAPNLEQQLDKSTADEAVQDRFETVSDTVVGENHEVEATESQEEIGDAQLGLHKDKCDQVPTKRDEAQGLCETTHEVDSTMSQWELPKENLVEVPSNCGEALGLCETTREADSTISQLELPKEKLDEVPTNCDEARGLCETTHEMGSTISQLELPKEKLDEVPTDCDEALGLCETHEVESTMSQLELPKEKLDEVPTECDEVMRLCEVEAQEGIGGPEPESYKEKFGQVSSECGEATGLCKAHEMEGTDSKEGCNVNGEPEQESHIENLACEFDSTNEVEGADNGGVNMELEHKNKEVDEKLQIESDEVNVDNSSIKEVAENVSMVEKVSELPKATATANDLEELIRELRGRVKDLEKKLSKNKKIKVNKCSSRKRSRGCVVQKNMVTKA